MDPTTPDIITAISSGFSSAIIQVVAAMLTPAMTWMTLPTMFVIQAVKATWNQCLAKTFGELNPETIWLLISPVCGMVVSFFMWNLEVNQGPHWVAAGCGAGLLANLLYAAVIKRLIFRFSPKARRINILKERRHLQILMPDGYIDRRRK